MIGNIELLRFETYTNRSKHEPPDICLMDVRFTEESSKSTLVSSFCSRRTDSIKDCKNTTHYRGRGGELRRKMGRKWEWNFKSKNFLSYRVYELFDFKVNRVEFQEWKVFAVVLSNKGQEESSFPPLNNSNTIRGKEEKKQRMSPNKWIKVIILQFERRSGKSSTLSDTIRYHNIIFLDTRSFLMCSRRLESVP